MATITAVNRNTITQILNRPASTNKLTKLSHNEFVNSIESLGVQSAEAQFIKLPSQTNIADKLFDKMACEGLPEKFRNIVLTEEGDAVRNMLGIIYKDVEPQDEAVFQKIFKEVSKENNTFNKEEKLSSELSFLFSKYGQNALNKHVAEYTQYCREAWAYHHTGVDQNTIDEDIFTPGVMACYDVLKERIDRLSMPNQTWTSVIFSGIYFKDTCAALSKALKYHDAADTKHPEPESPLRNTPQNNSPLGPDVNQPSMGNQDFSIPAGNGHGPITIQNTAQGGNGIATINGNSADSRSTSAADFGIALLNTPEEQLGNDKVRLVDKFMELYLGRAQNGGQDKFTDHVDGVVQATTLKFATLETLQAPAMLYAVEEFISMPEPQIATVIDAGPQPVMSHIVKTKVVPQMATVEQNSNVVPSSESSRLAPTDAAAKNLHGAARQVAQALSGLLTEVDTSLASKNGVENKSSEMMNSLQTDHIQGPQSITTPSITSTTSSAMGQSQVQQLVQKFEKLNTEHRMRNESATSMNHLETANTAFNRSALNSTQQTQRTDSSKSGFQPIKHAPSKFNVSVNQKPVYTTARTIDPFSRHSADLKHLSTSFNRKPEADDVIESSESGNNL